MSELGLDDLSLTTNGTTLARHAVALRDAGLTRVNVSLDSLITHRFARMTRRDALDRVLAGIAAAQDAGLRPVKVNCVVVGGTNDDEILDFVEFARRTGCEVRFIENMPLGADGRWVPDQVMPAAEVLEVIAAHHELVPRVRGAEPAASFDFGDGAPGGVGVIASVTEPFCATCDRLRLTSDGYLRTCLFAHTETDLRTPLRSGAGDAELVEVIRAAVAGEGPRARDRSGGVRTARAGHVEDRRMSGHGEHRRQVTAAELDAPLLGYDEAVRRITAAFTPLAAIDVPLADALGLVLAADVVADDDIPSFDNSAMDGFAVRSDGPRRRRDRPGRRCGGGRGGRPR